MEDPQLNKSLEETKELQTRWSQFREFVRMAIERGKVAPEAEMKFLELKSIIAILHDGFMAKLTHDQKVGQAIMSILGDSIMLSRIANYNEAEKQKFEFDWNECYLLISEQTQGLQDEKARLAGISERAYNVGKRKDMIKAKIHNFIHSAGLKYTIILALLAFFLYFVPAFMWSYRNLAGIPGLNRVYFLVADKIYRPYMNKEYAYDAYANLNLNEDVDVNPPVPRIAKIDAGNLTKKYFIDSELFEMGVSPQSVPQIGQLLNSGEETREFQSERFRADEYEVRFYYFFFKDTPTARRFVEMILTDYNSRSIDQKRTISEKFYMTRSANFVAIGKSTHGMRISHITGKMRRKADEDNLFRL